jgi:hypothetical protein
LKGGLKRQAQNCLEAVRTLNESFNNQQEKYKEEVLGHDITLQWGRQNSARYAATMDEHRKTIRMYERLLAIQIDKCREVFIVMLLSS